MDSEEKKIIEALLRLHFARSGEKVFVEGPYRLNREQRKGLCKTSAKSGILCGFKGKTIMFKKK